MTQKNESHAEHLSNARRRSAFSLIELLIVVAVIGVLTGMVLTHSRPTHNSQLESVAQILVSDSSYARSLAVSTNSSYSISFDLAKSEYILKHSGSNPSLDVLPTSHFDDGDSPNTRVTNLDALPQIGASVDLVSVQTVSSDNLTRARAEQIEFGPLGQLTQPQRVEIWLGCGHGDDRIYLPVSIAPITGLATIGQFATSCPQVAAAKL